jgi:hypothetical protein
MDFFRTEAPKGGNIPGRCRGVSGKSGLDGEESEKNKCRNTQKAFYCGWRQSWTGENLVGGADIVLIMVTVWFVIIPIAIIIVLFLFIAAGVGRCYH